MKLSRSPIGILAVCGLAAVASAQDSVSSAGGLPGDALDPYNANTQVTDFVVDLVDVTSSWGTQFGIAPILKFSRIPGSNFYNQLPSGAVISPDLVEETAFPAAEYALWTTPGAGVSPANSAPSLIAAPGGLSSQFTIGGQGFSPTGNGAGDNTNAIFGALVNYDPANPGRLYVRRVEAAVNQPSVTDPAFGQFGLGSADASGNLFFRGDTGDGIVGVTTGPFTALQNNNLYGVDLSIRGLNPNQVNQVSANMLEGDMAATFRFAENIGSIINPGNLHVPPSNIPFSAAGQRVVSTLNFDQENVRGPIGGIVNGTDHVVAVDPIDGTVSEDFRGSLRTVPGALLGSGVATSAAIIKVDTPLADLSPNDGSPEFQSRGINIWSVDANGTPIDRILLETPFVVTDPAIDPATGTGFTLDYSTGFRIFNQFRQFSGPAPFRSPTAPVAIGADQQGRVLAAATNSEFGDAANFETQILAARVNPDGTGEEWTCVAWIDSINPVAAFNVGFSGKAILDGPGGSVVGRLVDLESRSGGGASGTSMSSPVIDSVGNIWFLASVVLGSDADIINGNLMGLDFDTALIRAVYNPANFSYELEKVLELGDVIPGANSGTDYTPVFFSLVTQTGSASPAGMYSGSGRSTAWNNVDTAGLSTADPITNGGIVLTADIVYDSDGNGTFSDPTAGAGDPSSQDESYNVVLYVGYNGEGIIAEPELCSVADIDPIGAPNNIINVFDLIAFLQNFQPTMNCPADAQCGIANLDGDNDVDVFDLITFLQNFDPNDPNCQG